MNARLMGKRSVAVALVALPFIVMAVAISPAQALSMNTEVGTFTWYPKSYKFG